VSLGILSLVLLAACAHALWNLLSKQSAGGAVFVWWGSVSSAVVWAPAALVALLVAPGRLSWELAGFMAGSGGLHCLYFTLLQRAYATGDLSVVYPLARGTGPMLATIGAIVILGERPSALALAGAGIVVLAVFSLAGRPSKILAAGGAFAILTGVAIASYTLWDSHAVGPVGGNPLLYYYGTNLVNGALLSVWALRERDRVRPVWRSSRRGIVGVALFSPLAYVLVLYALAHAPVSHVAPARELSIVIATLLGTTVLAESDRRRRLFGSAGIVLGVVCLALG
jgi:drug/metabolite transporter (DMT)-like permease